MMMTMMAMMAMRRWPKWTLCTYDGNIRQNLFYNSAIKITCQDKNGTIELDEFLNMMATRFIMM